MVRSCGTVIAITTCESISWAVGERQGQDERLLSPVTFLMKICTVETASGDAERERGVEKCILRAACGL